MQPDEKSDGHKSAKIVSNANALKCRVEKFIKRKGKNYGKENT